VRGSGSIEQLTTIAAARKKATSLCLVQTDKSARIVFRQNHFSFASNVNGFCGRPMPIEESRNAEMESV
jgi:hypothetical protein